MIIPVIVHDYSGNHFGDNCNDTTTKEITFFLSLSFYLLIVRRGVHPASKQFLNAAYAFSY